MAWRTREVVPGGAEAEAEIELEAGLEVAPVKPELAFRAFRLS